MRETWVQSLGQEDLLKKEMAPDSSILAWKIPWKEEPSQATVHGLAKSWTRLSDFTHQCTTGIALGFPDGSDGKADVKHLPAMREAWV